VKKTKTSDCAGGDLILAFAEIHFSTMLPMLADSIQPPKPGFMFDA
jgi:hypothetical protein